MTQEKPATVINQTVLLWCGVIIVELFVIAHLMGTIWVLLGGLVLIGPLRAGFDWPVPVEDASAVPPAEQPPAR
jgi:hypothetical protein